MPTSKWLAPVPSKRWAECFFLIYSPVWIVALLGVVVPLRLYEVRHHATALPARTLDKLAGHHY